MAGGALAAGLSGRKPDFVDLAAGCLSGGLNKAPGIFKTAGSGGKSGKGPKPAKNFVPPANPPQPPPVPPGYVSGPTPNGRGTIYRLPGSTGDADTIQVYQPTAQYPNGYWKQFGPKGNPIDPSTGKQGTGPQFHHVPLPPGFFK